MADADDAESEEGVSAAAMLSPLVVAVAVPLLSLMQQSHCRAEMLIAASKVPGRKGTPWPASARRRSPSTSRSRAMLSMEADMSRPIHV